MFLNDGACRGEAVEDRGGLPAYGLAQQDPPLLRKARAGGARGQDRERIPPLRPREVARLELIKKAKLVGLTLGEIAELVSLAAEGSRGKVNHRLGEVLDSHLEEIERRMDELGDLRRSLLYYRHRLFEAEPAESCDCGKEEGVSFWGCLEAVSGEEEYVVSAQSLRRKP